MRLSGTSVSVSSLILPGSSVIRDRIEPGGERRFFGKSGETAENFYKNILRGIAGHTFIRKHGVTFGEYLSGVPAVQLCEVRGISTLQEEGNEFGI
jgi:hypothetical protein